MLSTRYLIQEMRNLKNSILININYDGYIINKENVIAEINKIIKELMNELKREREERAKLLKKRKKEKLDRINHQKELSENRKYTRLLSIDYNKKS